MKTWATRHNAQIHFAQIHNKLSSATTSHLQSHLTNKVHISALEVYTKQLHSI